MNEQKNMILAIAASAVILFGWHFFYDKPRIEAERAALEARQAQEQGIDTGDITILPDALQDLPILIDKNEILQSTNRLNFDNGRVSGSINLQGGHIDDLTLENYFTSLDKQEKIVLFYPDGTERPYYAHYNWGGKGTDFPNKDSEWKIAENSPKTLTANETVTIYWENTAGVRFEKDISLDDNFLFKIGMRIINNSASNIDFAPYGLVLRTDEPDVVDFYILHEGLVGVIDGSLQELDYDDASNDPNAGEKSTGGWLGITDKYWLAAVIPDQTSEVRMNFQRKAANQADKYPLFQSYFVKNVETLPAGNIHEYEAFLYAGAKETILLDEYEEEYNIQSFDLAVDFGWFYFLTKPIYKAIYHLNNYLGNFGLAILALTVLVKMGLLPLAYKSYASMSKMKLLQPQVAELKERFGDDKDGLRQAMMDLYKSEKVNPMSGCLPILLQIPVFFSLYKVLFVAIEMRHAPFYGWIKDLSAPDPLGVLTGFGLVNWEVPALLTIVNIGLWPIIMGVTMWLQQRLNPTPPDPIQAKIFGLMPFLFTFLLASFPAGLVIYWAWNNTLSILQQWYIMRIVGKRQAALAVVPVAAEVVEDGEDSSPDSSKPVKLSKVKNKKSRCSKKRR